MVLKGLDNVDVGDVYCLEFKMRLGFGLGFGKSLFCCCCCNGGIRVFGDGGVGGKFFKFGKLLNWREEFVIDVVVVVVVVE